MLNRNKDVTLPSDDIYVNIENKLDAMKKQQATHQNIKSEKRQGLTIWKKNHNRAKDALGLIPNEHQEVVQALVRQAHEFMVKFSDELDEVTASLDQIESWISELESTGKRLKAHAQSSATRERIRLYQTVTSNHELDASHEHIDSNDYIVTKQIGSEDSMQRDVRQLLYSTQAFLDLQNS